MGKRRELRNLAILSADLFMSNLDTILEKHRIDPDTFNAEGCLDTIRKELHSGVWDTVEEAVEDIEY